MFTFGPGNESGMFSLKLGVTSRYTAALVMPTNRPLAYVVSGTTAFVFDSPSEAYGDGCAERDVE